MCGIVAILDPRHPVQPEALARAVRALEHRGPDGQGTWLAPDRGAGLGLARLGVIDLEAGAQPLASEDGRIRAVVNGELYGFEALREGLEARGHAFRTRTDAEVLVHLYEEHGPACLEHLRGELAFALWDEGRQLLFCARDRMGAKPLFWARQGSALLVASEVKALQAAGVALRWELDAVHDAIWLGVPAPSRSLFQGVSQLPAGHSLTARGGEVRIRRYWELPEPRGQAAERGGAAAEAEAIAQVREALEQAVRLRLRADVPVGLYLSGGIDSAAVLGLAAAHQPGPLQAFTLSFGQPRYDELEAAASSARRSGAALTAVPVTGRELADRFGDAVWHAETFVKNAHGGARLALAAAVRRAGLKVVLTGEGGDEVFGGYPPFRRDLRPGARAGPPSGQDGVEHGMLPAGAAGGRPPPLPALEAQLGFVPSFFQDQAASARMYLSLCSGAFLSSSGGRDAHQRLLEELDCPGWLRDQEPLRQSLYLWARTALPGYLLPVLGDRPEMAHSVEGRLPFLDHRVVEAAARLPAGLLIRGGAEKHALREAVRPLVTERAYRSPKRLFLAPPVFGDAPGPLAQLAQDTVRSAALDSVPFLDAAKVRRLFDLLPSREERVRIAHDPVVCTAVSACLLQRRFGL